MKNIQILDRSIDIEKIKNEILTQPNNWLYNTFRQKNIWVQKNTESIPLVNGYIDSLFNQQKFNDTDQLQRTKMFNLYPNTVNFLYSKFGKYLQRIMIVKLKPRSIVFPHIDIGKYYQNNDRYHLVIQGKYIYGVGCNVLSAYPGYLFKFNNKKIHWSVNPTKEDRLSIIFDVNPDWNHERKIC